LFVFARLSASFECFGLSSFVCYRYLTDHLAASGNKVALNPSMHRFAVLFYSLFVSLQLNHLGSSNACPTLCWRRCHPRYAYERPLAVPLRTPLMLLLLQVPRPDGPADFFVLTTPSSQVSSSSPQQFHLFCFPLGLFLLPPPLRVARC
jgi:hypothetical protein